MTIAGLKLPRMPELSLANVKRWLGNLLLFVAMVIPCFFFGGAITFVFSPDSWVTLLIFAMFLVSLVGGIWLFTGSLFGGRAASIGFLILTTALIETTFRRREFTAQTIDAQTLLKLSIWCWGLLIALRDARAVLAGAIKWPMLPMFLFCILCLLSTIWSVTPSYTFGGGVALVALALYMLYCCTVFDEKILYWSILIGLIFPLILSLGLYVASPSSAMAVMEGGNILRLAGMLGSPNGVGRVASLALIVMLLMLVDKHASWRNPFILVFFILSLISLQLSGSRTSLACVLVIVAYLISRRYKGLAFLGLAIAVILASVAYVFPELVHAFIMNFSRTGSASEVYTLTGRTDIWSFGWDKFIEAPFLGFGYGSTKLIYPEGYHTFWGFTVTHAHNMFLQTLITLGLLGFFLMLALFIAQIYWLIRQPDKFRDCIFIYVFLSSLTEAGAMGTGPNTLTVLWLMSLAMSVCRPLATTAQSIDRAAT